jgi:competence protein ComGC
MAEEGFTFVENLIAIAIVVLFFASLFAVNSQGLYLLNSGREAVVAMSVCAIGWSSCGIARGRN